MIVARGGAPRIVICGDALIDEVLHVPHLAQHGLAIAPTSWQPLPGGKGANVAAAVRGCFECELTLQCARAGADAVFLGDVGRDGSGGVIKQALIDAGVDTSLMRADKVDASASGDVAILVLSEPDITPLLLPDLSRCDALIVNNELATSEIRRALQAATDAGVLTLSNPAPLPRLWSSYPHELVDWMVVNEPKYAIAVASEAVLGRIGTIVTLGPLGARAITRSGLVVEVPLAFSVTPINTVGAGDCCLVRSGSFALADGQAYFATAIAELPREVSADQLRHALRFATAAASMSTERDGSISSYCPAAEVRARLAKTQTELSAHV